MGAPVVQRTIAYCRVLVLVGAGACGPTADPARPETAARATAPRPTATPDAAKATPPARVFSAFGGYAPLPDWSGWCGLRDDDACAEPLARAVADQTAQSRPTVRQHGWHLWAAIWAPIAGEGARNDAAARRTSLFGTDGCWSRHADGAPACSGFYPIWLTWPNTGIPHAAAPAPDGALVASTAPARGATTLRTKRQRVDPPRVTGDPDPTRVATVNTDAPTYALPPLALARACRIDAERAAELLAAKKYADIATLCERAAPGVFCAPRDGQAPAFCDGTAFVNQGDVMIATESLSVEGYDDIQRSALYDADVLEKMYAARDGSVGAKIGRKFVSTKHMFWPVKGCKPGVAVGEAGCRVRYGALPPWVPRDLKHIDFATNADYVGYERWKSVVAIDTCTSTDPAVACPPGGAATLRLAHVTGARPISTKDPKVYTADDFLHVQVSREALEQRFTAADRALLDQATIWAYGDESGGFEPGDFLVAVAMHVNTKEIPSWGLQSVWWSPMSDALADCPLAEYDHCFGQTGGYAATAGPDTSAPNASSGLTPAQLAAIDARVGATWRAHYLMTDSYGIRRELDGAPVTADHYFKGAPPAWASTGPAGQPLPLLPVSVNVYIEPVIHPIGTDCQNCHRRAGYPDAGCAAGEYPGGCGRANYQTAQCPDLLGDYGPPGSDPCMTTPWAWHGERGDACKAEGGTLCAGPAALPILDTDLIWLLADLHIRKQ